MKKLSLPYEEMDVDGVKGDSIQTSVKVDENLFNPKKLKELCWNYLGMYLVDVKLNTEYDEKNSDRFMFIDLFAKINGLSINFDKSNFFTFDNNLEKILFGGKELKRTPSNFKYLGMNLIIFEDEFYAKKISKLSKVQHQAIRSDAGKVEIWPIFTSETLLSPPFLFCLFLDLQGRPRHC